MKDILLRQNKIRREQEHCWVVCLSANNTILNIELVSLGAIDEATLKPMQIFRIAIFKGAVKLIIVHNHPHGDVEPSKDDKDVTDRMIQVGNIVNIDVFDHLIITETHYLSFRDEGIMRTLRLSKNFVPQYIEEKRLKEQAFKIGQQIGEKKGLRKGKREGKIIGLEQGVKKEKKETAKKMLKDGLTIETISKYTGLKKHEIEKLIKTQATQTKKRK